MKVLTIHTIHHVPSVRKNVILGISDDPVDPTLRPAFKSQTRSLVRLVNDLITKNGISAAAYTSSMKRQKETCELLFANTHIPIVIDERLRQIDNGHEYTGMNSDLAKKDYLQFINDPFPGGESFTDFAQRVREFLEEISSQHADHTIITVGWRLSPAILAHVCRGISLEQAIADNNRITGPFTYQ